MRRFEPTTDRNAALPVMSVAVTVAVWGLVSPLVKYASLSGPALGFHRLWIGSLLLLIVFRAGRAQISASTLRWAIPAGIIFGVNMIAFVVAVKLTTVANATMIGALQPAIVLLVAGRWFGETVRRREIACVGVALAGVTIVIAGSTGAPEWNPVGDGIAAASVLTYTAYFIVTKQARATVGTLEYVTFVHLAAACVAAPIALARPGELVSFSPIDVAIVLFFALVSGTAGQFVIGWAHRYVDISLSSLMMLGVPIVAALAAWAMLGEALGIVQIAGGLITLGAIAAMLRRQPVSDAAAGAEPRGASALVGD